MSVFLYIPNLIGYLRVALLGVAMWHAFSDFRVFLVAYAVSQLLDAADGWAARKFHQSSAFGAVLDMVTDRVSSNLLLMVLGNLHFRFFLFFAFLAALDYSSHWTQMYASVFSGNSSHKDIASSRPWLLQVYYKNKVFLFLNCLCQEAALLALYLLHFHTQAEMISILGKITGTLTAFVSGIAAVSLLVGCIGIVNISVTFAAAASPPWLLDGERRKGRFSRRQARPSCRF